MDSGKDGIAVVKPHILLVDERDDDVAVTRRALADNRIVNEVVVLRDGTAACDYLFGAGSETRELPAVILLALKLPKVSGLDVLERIRSDRRTRRLPIVILTSSKHEEDALEARFQSGHGYVRKPIDFSELLQAVHSAGLKWLLIDDSQSPES